MNAIELYVSESGVLLEKALEETQGNPAETQRVRRMIDAVMRVYTRYRLDELKRVAQALNELSDVLDETIRNVRASISNFLLGEFISLKKKVDSEAGNASSETRHEHGDDYPSDDDGGGPSPNPAPTDSERTHSKKQLELFSSAKIRSDWVDDADWVINRLIAEKARKSYNSVSLATGVPWWFIAIIHALETSINFGQHLHNGDPLTGKTVRVPKGRPPGSPPFEWKESAIDALTMDSHALDKIEKWPLKTALLQWELYNGKGYWRRGLNSPYLWSGTNHYTKGKYIADGRFDPDAVSKQVGAATLLKRMMERNIVKLDSQSRVEASPRSSLGEPGQANIDLSPFPHAKKELEWPAKLYEGIAKTAKNKAGTKRVQEWCCHHKLTDVD